MCIYIYICNFRYIHRDIAIDILHMTPYAPVRASFDLPRPHKARTPTKSTTDPKLIYTSATRTATDATQALKVLRIEHASNMLNMHKATLPSKSDMHKASEMPWRNAIKACRPRIHCRWYVVIIERNHLRGNCVTCYSLKCNVQTRKLQDDPEKFLQNVDGFHACNKRPKPIVSPWLASSPVRTLKCGKHLQAAPSTW